MEKGFKYKVIFDQIEILKGEMGLDETGEDLEEELNNIKALSQLADEINQPPIATFTST